MNKVYGYAQALTWDQNLDTQSNVLQEAGCDEILQDEINSTSLSLSRPALDELLAKLQAGDTVIVAHFFRLGRSRDHLIALLGQFARKGIHVKALDLELDSATPAGRLVLQTFAALTDYDRLRLRQKTRAGQLLAAARGKQLGRPKGVHPDKLAKVSQALEGGLSVADTVRLTGISTSSVNRYRKYLEAQLG